MARTSFIRGSTVRSNSSCARCAVIGSAVSRFFDCNNTTAAAAPPSLDLDFIIAGADVIFERFCGLPVGVAESFAGLPMIDIESDEYDPC